MNTGQLMWLCCLYEKECLGSTPRKPDGKHYIDCSGGCKGTGHMPLLEGVRETCNYIVNRMRCWKCHGLGWTPTEDAWKWIEAASSLGAICFSRAGEDNPVRRRCQIGTYAEGGRSLSDAFFVAFVAELCTFAVNAAEAQEWVKENIREIA